MGRARENFNSVYFKDETGVQMSFANGSYANKLRFIFWNLMDSHVLKLEGPACDFTVRKKVYVTFVIALPIYCSSKIFCRNYTSTIYCEKIGIYTNPSCYPLSIGIAVY